MPCTIINSFQSKSGNGGLKAGQVEQQLGDQCTELEYNVYSQDSSAQIHIHADGPCGDKVFLGKLRLTVNFLPFICPIGFHKSQSENDCTVEPPNKGHFGDNINSAVVSFVEILSSRRRFKMY